MSGTRRKAGPLTPFVADDRCKLLAMGYAPETARGLLKVLGQLGRRMAVNDVVVSQLDWETITRFLVYRRSDSYRQTRIAVGCVSCSSSLLTSTLSSPGTRRRCLSSRRYCATTAVG